MNTQTKCSVELVSKNTEHNSACKLPDIILQLALEHESQEKPILLESELFDDCHRCQLTVTSTRQDTYIANCEGEQVFVKGPFRSFNAAANHGLVNSIKNTLSPQLPTIETRVLRLRADLFPDCALGMRKTLRDEGSTDPVYFLVSQVAFPLSPIHLTDKTTKNAWTTPTSCIDWKAYEPLGFYSHLPYSREYDATFYADFKAAAQVVMHVACCWLMGCGGDLAMRNFIWNKNTNTVYQIDMDNLRAWHWRLPRTAIAAERTMAGAHMIRFLEGHRDEMESSLAEILDNAKRYASEADGWAEMAKRAEYTGAVDWMLALLKEEVGPKKQSSAKTAPAKRAALDSAPAKKLKTAAGKCYAGVANPAYRSAVDAFGCAISARISDIQKATRLDMSKQLLCSFFACYNMRALFDTPRGKAIATNALNRLAVISVEDIGVANLPLVLHILRELPELKKSYTRETRNKLVALLSLMAHSKKTRIQSHLYHTYHPANADLASQNGFDGGEWTSHWADARVFGLVDSRPEWLWTQIKDSDSKLYDAVFPHWKKASKKNKRPFLQFALAVEHFAHVERTRRYIAKKKKQSCAVAVPPDLPVLVKQLETNDFDGGGARKPMQVSYDMHTAEGRSAIPKSEQKRQFKTIGARVKHQHPHFYSEKMEQIYINSRV